MSDADQPLPPPPHVLKPKESNEVLDWSATVSLSCSLEPSDGALSLAADGEGVAQGDTDLAAHVSDKSTDALETSAASIPVVEGDGAALSFEETVQVPKAEAVRLGVREGKEIKAVSPWIEADIKKMAQENPPLVQWLAEGLIPAGAPGFIASRAGAGKSMIAILVAIQLAAGTDVLGRNVNQDVNRGVLYVSMEDDGPECWRRIYGGVAMLKEDPAWQAENEMAFTSRLKLVFPDRSRCRDFRLDSQVEHLRTKASEVPGGCGLIVLDTLARLSAGDENSALGMRPFLEAQSALAQATGATVMAIHHIGKAGSSGSDKPIWDRLSSESLRGSSTIEASGRFVLTMSALTVAEAESAGLDPVQAQRSAYVALCLAKTNQGEKGGAMLLERRTKEMLGAGYLVPHPDSEEILDRLRNGKIGKKKLNLGDKVLLAIAAAGSLSLVDLKEVQASLWPNCETAENQWQKQISGLRKSFLLEEKELTTVGWERAEELGFTPPEEELEGENVVALRIEKSLPPEDQ